MAQELGCVRMLRDKYIFASQTRVRNSTSSPELSQLHTCIGPEQEEGGGELVASFRGGLDKRDYQGWCVGLRAAPMPAHSPASSGSTTSRRSRPKTSRIILSFITLPPNSPSCLDWTQAGRGGSALGGALEPSRLRRDGWHGGVAALASFLPTSAAFIFPSSSFPFSYGIVINVS